MDRYAVLQFDFVRVIYMVKMADRSWDGKVYRPKFSNKPFKLLPGHPSLYM